MHGRVALALVPLAFLTAAPARVAPSPAPIKTADVEYRQGATVLRGFVAWDDAAAGKRPGVLIVHEWWGLTDNIRAQARRLAEAGYMGFALDMYGDGKFATHPDDAKAWMAEVTKDPATIAARFNAGLARLKQDPHVDTTRLAAIGYCFGGGVVLAMARAGVDLDAVATFHGMLATQSPAKPGAIKARVLALTGGADPFVPAEQVEAFKKEMQAAGARFEVVSYPGAKHGFTNPSAGTYGMAALAYDSTADRQSWAALLKMLGEVFR